MAENTTRPATTPGTFNPLDYLIDLGGNPYLEVKWRLVWLREEHPDAVVVTDRRGGDADEFAVFWASVALPGGGSATGWGSETFTDFRDWLEKAETKALGRALGALGYDEHHAVIRFGTPDPRRPATTTQAPVAPQDERTQPHGPNPPPAPASSPQRPPQPPPAGPRAPRMEEGALIYWSNRANGAKGMAALVEVYDEAVKKFGEDGLHRDFKMAFDGRRLTLASGEDQRNG